MCWCGFLYVSFLWGSLTFLDMRVYSFCHIYNILVIISSSTFSVTSLFWVSNYTMLDCLILSHRLQMHCPFCKNFLSLCFIFEYFLSLSVYFNVFKFTDLFRRVWSVDNPFHILHFWYYSSIHQVKSSCAFHFFPHNAVHALFHLPQYMESKHKSI